MISFFRSFINKFFKNLFRGKKHIKLGIYGSPNSGKTTLANKICKDWLNQEMGKVSKIPHETREIQIKEQINIKSKDGKEITFNLVDTPGIATKIDFEDFIKPFDLEERIYRMRCVEAWSMVIPWVGIPLAEVVKFFSPTSKAQFVAFETLNDPEQMPGVRRPNLDWPYREGLTIAEATNPLPLLAVGIYGRAIPNQNGAPIRLVVPWKYGFKGIKSIVKISFTSTQPQTSWNMATPREYGFYANVNPQVDHPRWSQARERRIGSGLFAGKQETLMFNGYGEHVAHLYKDLNLRRNF